MADVSLDPTSQAAKVPPGVVSFIIKSYAGLPRKLIVLDIVERLFLCALFVQFAVRFSIGTAFQVDGILIILAELLPVVLVLSRGPSRTLSDNAGDWLFGTIGAAAPLLIVAAKQNTMAPLIIAGYVLTLFGMSAQVAAKICLGRSFGLIAANRGVRDSGPYRFVRHPMYAGYIITYAGIVLMIPSLINALIYAVVTGVHCIRILREERILSQDPAYREFMSRVRYRLLPGVF